MCKFKVGDKVVAIIIENLDETKTEKFYGYVSDMIEMADNKEIMEVVMVTENLVRCRGYNWHMDDLMLAVPEDLENV